MTILLSSSMMLGQVQMEELSGTVTENGNGLGGVTIDVYATGIDRSGGWTGSTTTSLNGT